MSRLDDLIDLIQTTNEVYFITAPGRVRTTFILVDDIDELALKTFLQEKSLEQRGQFQQALENANLVSNRQHRNALDEFYTEDIDLVQLGQRLGLGNNARPQLQPYIDVLTPSNLLHHWSVNDPDDFKKFPEVVRDVRTFFTANPLVGSLLDNVANQHQTRNTFYHDHRQIGLTIDDDKCLRALCLMIDLLENLFPELRTKIQSNKTVRCQIGVLRLKLAAHLGANELVRPYYDALEQLKKNHQFDLDPRSVEHSLIHTVSDRFFLALREQFKSSVAQLEFRVNEINRMARPHLKQVSERTDKQELIRILSGQLDAIETLLRG